MMFGRASLRLSSVMTRGFDGARARDSQLTTIMFNTPNEYEDAQMRLRDER